MKTFFKLAVSLSLCGLFGISSAYAHHSFKRYPTRSEVGLIKVTIQPEWNWNTRRYEADYTVKWGGFEESRTLSEISNQEQVLYYDHYQRDNYPITVTTEKRGRVISICQQPYNSYFEWSNCY